MSVKYSIHVTLQCSDAIELTVPKIFCTLNATHIQLVQGILKKLLTYLLTYLNRHSIG